MATPPTLVQVGTGTAVNVPASTGTAVTPSLSWQVGDVIVVLAGTAGAGTETWVTPTTSGSGVSLALQQSHNYASDCSAAVWSATATAASSGAFTVKNPSTTVAEWIAAGVYIWRNSGGVGHSNVSTGASRTCAMSSLGADSAIMWAEYDWNAGSVSAPTPTATTHSTAAPGPSASPLAANVSGQYTYWVEELDDQPSTASIAYGTTSGTGTGPYSIVVIEVLGSGAANPRRKRIQQPVPIMRAANF